MVSMRHAARGDGSVAAPAERRPRALDSSASGLVELRGSGPLGVDVEQIHVREAVPPDELRPREHALLRIEERGQDAVDLPELLPERAAHGLREVDSEEVPAARLEHTAVEI